MLNMSIYGDENIRRAAGTSNVELSSLRANHIALRPPRAPVPSISVWRPSHAAMRRANRNHHQVSLWLPRADRLSIALVRAPFGADSPGEPHVHCDRACAAAACSWRTPAVLIAVGCAIALIAFGPRSALGQFLTPMSFDHGWGREAFSFAHRDPESAVGRGAAVRRRHRRPLRPGARAVRRRDPLCARAWSDGQRDLDRRCSTFRPAC